MSLGPASFPLDWRNPDSDHAQSTKSHTAISWRRRGNLNSVNYSLADYADGVKGNPIQRQEKPN